MEGKAAKLVTAFRLTAAVSSASTVAWGKAATAVKSAIRKLKDPSEKL